jgi:hypothetical protein
LLDISKKLKRAQILLAADTGVGDEDIAASVWVGGSTVYRTKRRFVEGNLERALSEEARPGAEPARVHHAARRRSGRMAACGERAAAGQAADRRVPWLRGMA